MLRVLRGNVCVRACAPETAGWYTVQPEPEAASRPELWSGTPGQGTTGWRWSPRSSAPTIRRCYPGNGGSAASLRWQAKDRYKPTYWYQCKHTYIWGRLKKRKDAWTTFKTYNKQNGLSCARFTHTEIADTSDVSAEHVNELRKCGVTTGCDEKVIRNSQWRSTSDPRRLEHQSVPLLPYTTKKNKCATWGS